MEHSKKKKINRVILWAILGAVIILWCGGVIPKQIARLAGTHYARTHFREMQLTCTRVEWAAVYGDYLITFTAHDGSMYNCVIAPAIFPVSLRQGLFAIESDYAENYK